MRRCVIALLAISLSARPPAPQMQRRRLRADLDFLTSDALAGRLSLSPQADVAALYIAAEFQKCGLQPADAGSYLQKFPLVGYVSNPKGSRLVLTRNGKTKAYLANSDFTGAFYRDVEIQAPVVFAGFGITAPEYGYDDYADLNVKGKIVLLFDHEPQEDNPRSIFNGAGHTIHANRQTKLVNAQRHGAVGVLIASEPVRSHPGILDQKRQVTADGRQIRATAPSQANDDPAQIPAFSIGEATLEELLAPAHRRAADLQKAIEAKLKPQSAPLPDTVIEMVSVNASQQRGTSLNVAGLLEGADPVLKSETILITAHYDHLGAQNGNVYRGANDNGSGTVAVMELARLFAGSPARPRRSILFVVFGSEEEVMLGSYYYTAHPLRPLGSTRAVLNLDMIGRDEAHIPQSEGVLRIPADTTNHLNLVGTTYSPELRGIIERENKSVGLTLDTKFDGDHTINALFRCDHLPFLLERIPAVWFFGGFHPGYHEPSDTAEKLNFKKMESVISLVYRTAEAIAETSTPPGFITASFQ